MIRRLAIAVFVASFALAICWHFSTPAEAQDVVILQGTLNKKKLKRNKRYLLRGGVFIKKKLVIQSGTTINAEQGAFLVIDKGAEIDAEGTRDRPIVFTSAQPVGQRRRGDWGGLIFNGNAPVNCAAAAGGTCQGEGNTGAYGGNDPADNSGIMRFVRVEYGGFAISPENELNGIAFQGVGSGSDFDFIAAAFGNDDAIEMFGGSVNFKHAVGIGAADDSFDWTFGWNGKVQFAVIQHRGDAPETDRGIEADNNENNFDFTPRSAPKLSNFTLVGDPAGPGSRRGITLRRGTAGDLRNFIVMNFRDVGLEVVDAPTITQFNNDGLALRAFIFFNNGNALTTPANFSAATSNLLNAKGLDTRDILVADPLLRDPLSKTAPDFRPNAGSPALNPANVQQFTGDSFFTAAEYVGAFDANDDWTLGWVNWVLGN